MSPISLRLLRWLLPTPKTPHASVAHVKLEKNINLQPNNHAQNPHSIKAAHLHKTESFENEQVSRSDTPLTNVVDVDMRKVNIQKNGVWLPEKARVEELRREADAWQELANCWKRQYMAAMVKRDPSCISEETQLGRRPEGKIPDIPKSAGRHMCPTEAMALAERDCNVAAVERDLGIEAKIVKPQGCLGKRPKSLRYPNGGYSIQEEVLKAGWTNEQYLDVKVRKSACYKNIN